MMDLRFILNGAPVRDRVEPDRTLLDYLRGVRCLKGAKQGCGTGHCGACTVLVDGKPARSCVLRLKGLAGKTVLTIEGLAGEGELHPIQAAFLEAGAVQCGFCTPGMILAAKALLDKNPRPTRDEMDRAFAHNYCRCTGYAKIIRAVRLAAEKLYPDELPFPAAPPLEQSRYLVQGQPGAQPGRYEIFGRHAEDLDGAAKVTGGLPFADDLELPGMLIARPVWSGVPRGKIVCLDVEKARAHPGVAAVLTAADVPGYNGFGMVNQDMPVFCEQEVNFVRDLVALVLGETEQAAREGVELVEVEIEPLPGLYDIEAPGAEHSLIREIVHEKGDLAAAKAEPDLLVLHTRVRTTWQEHAYLEPESALAYPEGEGIVVKTPTQSPFELRGQLAKVLALPEEAVRVMVTPLGGGFGGKGDATIQPVAAVAAFCTRRPVKITLTREESLEMSTKRHPYLLDYEAGFDREGRLRYVDADARSDAGPYSALTPRVIDQSSIFAVGPYRVEAARVRGRAVRTNNVLSGAFRGFGINQSAMAMETLLDQAARALNIDPFDIRMRNAVRQGDQTFSGETLYTSVGIRDTIDACRAELETALDAYRDRYPAGDPNNDSNSGKVLGVGMASCFKNVGAGKGRVDDAGATATRRADGSFLVKVSGVDMGQGFRTAMCQIAAETLGVPMERISLFNGDTRETDRHGSAAGERQTLICGMAVHKACAALAEKLRRNPDPGEELSAHVIHTAPKTFSLGDIEGRRSVPPEEYKNYPSYAYATHAAIVEVDRGTGQIKVLEIVAAHDTGRVVNPTILEGQIQGSCAMGIGYALSEQYRVENGVPLTKNYGQLGVPAMEHTPRYRILFVEDPEPSGPYGAKGISEIAMVPVAPAILNAVYDAVGVRLTELPATPARVLAALEAKARGEG